MVNPELGRAPYDPRINVYDRTELRHWAREFGVSERQLMHAVDKAGTSIEALNNELRRGSTRSAMREGSLKDSEPL